MTDGPLGAEDGGLDVPPLAKLLPFGGPVEGGGDDDPEPKLRDGGAAAAGGELGLLTEPEPNDFDGAAGALGRLTEPEPKLRPELLELEELELELLRPFCAEASPQQIRRVAAASAA